MHCLIHMQDVINAVFLVVRLEVGEARAFVDPRKKMPLMPRKEHIENLYDELLRWPNRYRLYFALVQPELAARAVPLHVKSFLNTCGQHRFGLLKKSQARRQTGRFHCNQSGRLGHLLTLVKSCTHCKRDSL